MRKKYVWLAFCVISLVVLVPAFVAAEDAQITALNKIVQAKVEKINIWNSIAQTLAMLTLVVAILGAITGILSQIEAKWTKIVIALAGAAIAILTAVINIRYPVDYKTYKKLSADATMIVDQINMQISWMSGIKDPNEIRKFIDDNIMPKLQQITDFDKQLIHARNDTAVYGISEAFAQEMAPQWITNPPKEGDTLYFVGFGVSSDPKKAENTAIDYTKATARIIILDALVESEQKKGNPSNPLIVQSVLDGASVINKFVKYDAQKKVFRHFSLLRIDIDTIQSRLALLAAREHIVIPPKFIEQLKNINKPQEK